MSLLIPSGSREVLEPLPSPPPSPTEEDLGGASVWREVSEEEALKVTSPSLANGNGSVKGKERAPEIFLDEVEDENDGIPPTPTLDGRYPPQKEEEEETRRVEENLRRLEEAERQRRKAVREASASTAPSSVIADVSRRASLLLSSQLSRTGGSSSGVRSPGRARSGSRPALHHVHSQLGQSSEDALPLEDIHAADSNMLVSPTPSKPSSPTPPSVGLPIPTIVENPFEMPDSATPIRGFSYQDEDDPKMDGSAGMRTSIPLTTTSSGPSTDRREVSGKSPFDDQDRRPTLQEPSSSSFSRPSHPTPPPPLPLDLPPPKTPPPRVDTPGGSPIVTSPPRRVSTPSTTRRREGANAGSGNKPDSRQRQRQSSNDDQTEAEEHRWWTDWLCGCREEKDSDNAGRTNPFE